MRRQNTQNVMRVKRPQHPRRQSFQKPHNSNKKNNLLLMSGLTAFALVGLVLGLTLAEGGIQIFLLCVAVLSLLFVVFPITLCRNYFIFEPLSYVIVSVVFGMFLKTFYIILGVSSNTLVSDRLLLGINLSEIQYGSMVILIALCLFSFGYVIADKTVRTSRNHKPYYFSYKKSVIFSSILILVSGIFFFLLIISTGFSFNDFSDLSQKRFLGDGKTPSARFENIGYYYYRLTLLSKAPMYILFYICLKYRLSWTSLPGVLFSTALLINILVPFYVSNKAGIILPLADLLVISYIVTGRLNLKRTLILAGTAVLLMGVIAVFRGGESVSSLSILDKIFANRYFIEITKTSHIVNSVPNIIDYFYGKSFIGWMNLLLPKDMELNNIYFSDMGFYLGSQVFNTNFSGVTPGIVAEFYLNFGMFGVVIGMLLLGYFLKWLHIKLASKFDSFAVIMIYTVIVIRAPAFLFNSSFSVTLLKTIADLIIIGFFLLLVRTNNRSQGLT